MPAVLGVELERETLAWALAHIQLAPAPPAHLLPAAPVLRIHDGSWCKTEWIRGRAAACGAGIWRKECPPLRHNILIPPPRPARVPSRRRPCVCTRCECTEVLALGRLRGIWGGVGCGVVARSWPSGNPYIELAPAADENSPFDFSGGGVSSHDSTLRLFRGGGGGEPQQL